MYQAVDFQGKTIEFMLSAKRDKKAAKRFFRKALKAFHTSEPRVINVELNPAYPTAMEELKAERILHSSLAYNSRNFLWIVSRPFLGKYFI